MSEDKELVQYYICKTKKKYKNRKKAWESALYFFINLGTMQRPYQCNFCKKYHLTSKGLNAGGLSLEFKQGFNKWFGQPIYETAKATDRPHTVPEVPQAVQLHPLPSNPPESTPQPVLNLRWGGGTGAKV